MNKPTREPKSLHSSLLVPFAVLALGLIIAAFLAAQIPGAPKAAPYWTPRPMPTGTPTPTPDWWNGLPTGTPALPGLPAVPTVTLGQQPGQTGGSDGPVTFQVESCPGPESQIAPITSSGVWWLVDCSAAVAPLLYWKIELSPAGTGWTPLYRSNTAAATGRLIGFNIPPSPSGL